MFSKQPLYQAALAHVTFGVASLIADYGVSQESAGEATAKPAATAPAQDNPTLQRENFSTKYRDEIRNAIAYDLDTTQVIVFSVPDFCAPCRAYEPELEKLQKLLESEGGARDVRILVVEFSDFQQSADETVVTLGSKQIVLARQVPTTLIVPKLSEERRTGMNELLEKGVGGQDSFLPDTLTRPAYRFTGAAKAQELQGAIRRVEEYTDQQIGSKDNGNNAPKGPIRTLLDARRRWLGLPN